MDKLDEFLIQEAKVYLEEVGKLLSDYIGVEITLPIEDIKNNGDIDFGFRLISEINLSLYEDIAYKIAGNLIDILEKNINTECELDWSLLATLQKDLSLSFIFNKEKLKDSLYRYKCTAFLDDLSIISGKTYESTYTEYGFILSDTDGLKELLNRYRLELIEIEPKKGVVSFFETEKPFLRLLNGNNNLIVVDENFMVMGILHTVNPQEIYLTKSIIDEILEYNFIKHVDEIKREFSNKIEKVEELVSSSSGEKPEVVKGILATINEGIRTAFINTSISKANYILFKVFENKTSIYVDDSFVITSKNGNWKVQNYQMLHYIILNYCLLRNQLFLVLGDKEKENDVLLHISGSVKKLFNLICDLSNESISTLIIIKADSYGDFDLSLDTSTVNERLKELPLRAPNTSKEFSKLIKKGGRHFNIQNLSVSYLKNLCSIDGAIIFDDSLNILSIGEVIEVGNNGKELFGTGTNACQEASKNALAIKISEDGDIKVFMKGKEVLKI
ncbi:hypothetical protein ACIQVU_18610 [Lysinibacillus sp. NPDC098008]|uniref:hypothetical protein n=1 Tax=Lysinibacillus sp. NPDC098008 TaxID=3364146 RepID=UPI00380D0EAD